MGNTETILRQWLDVRVTDSGIIVAQQNHLKPPLLVAQLTEEWLNHYRKLALSLRSANNQNYNYNNNGGNISMTSNNVSQSNVTRPTVRRTSPKISQYTSVVTTTSPVPASSSASNTTLVEAGIPGQSITNSIISGNRGGDSNTKGMTNPNSPSNQVCYSSDGDSDEE
jgi:hypothetical protein